MSNVIHRYEECSEVSFVGLAVERANDSRRAVSEGGALDASMVCSAYSFEHVILMVGLAAKNFTQ